VYSTGSSEVFTGSSSSYPIVLNVIDTQDDVAILAHHEAKSFDGASSLPTDPPQTDFPRQTGVPKHLRRRLQLVHLYPETMPRGFTRVREL
jgi:hypothetical protein